MKETIRSLATPFLWFWRWEAKSGAILLLGAVVALLLANSPLAGAYHHVLHMPIRLGVGAFSLELGLLHWINDGLMAVFFFVIGLEIKREFLYGELKTRSAMMLPSSMHSLILARRRRAAGASRWPRTSLSRSAS